MTDDSLPRFPDETLLAVDLGLRAGMAWYGRDGRLLRYGSRHFGSRGQMRKAVRPLLAGVGWLVLEGNSLAGPWVRAAADLGVPARVISAEEWRPALLLPRERRSGSVAKAHADRLARLVVAWSLLPPPRSLRHDAAEAILVGLWAVRQVGWLEDDPPVPLRG